MSWLDKVINLKKDVLTPSFLVFGKYVKGEVHLKDCILLLGNYFWSCSIVKNLFSTYLPFNNIYNGCLKHFFVS